MNTLKTRVLHSALVQKGFVPREGDHRFYFLYVDGKKTSVRTMISHGMSEYRAALLGRVRHQMALTNQEFQDFVNCPLSAEGYVDLLISKGRIQP